MSESIQASWDLSGDLDTHRKHFEAGIEAIQNTLIIPDDFRYETAYALLATGRGQKNSVVAIGEPASGKTSFGDLLMGVENRVEIVNDDTEATLYGYNNPIKAGEVISGKLGTGLRSDGLFAYANEISHLKNTAPLHRLWDAKSLEVDGERIDVGDVAIYGTSNFPSTGGGNRVHKLDPALRSRATLLMLTGDNSQETARLIQGKNAVKNKDISMVAPILPTAETRRELQRLVAKEYRMSSDLAAQNGRYIVSLIDQLNRSGLVAPVNPSDARIGEGFYDAARAQMFARNATDEHGNAPKLAPRFLANVAALALPSVVDLSFTAINRLNEAAGRNTTAYEHAIAVRRLISRVAFSAFLQELGERPDATFVQSAVERYSYANPEAITIDVDQALFGGKPAPVTEEQSDGRKRKIFGRKSR